LTDIVFSDLPVFLALVLFMYFFYLGYSSEKRSGGAFMLFSGFVMFYLEFAMADYISSVLVLGLVSPVAIFIILLGLKKFLYKDSGEDMKKND